MFALHCIRIRAARARSPRRWATGAVIAAALLAEAPRASDRTPDRATPGAAEPRAACDRPAAGALHRSRPAPLAGSPGGTGASPRPALHHLIGL